MWKLAFVSGRLCPFPQEPKYLQDQLLGFQNPVIRSFFMPKALEYEVVGIMDVQGFGMQAMFLMLFVWTLKEAVQGNIPTIPPTLWILQGIMVQRPPLNRLR